MTPTLAFAIAVIMIISPKHYENVSFRLRFFDNKGEKKLPYRAYAAPKGSIIINYLFCP